MFFSFSQWSTLTFLSLAPLIAYGGLLELEGARRTEAHRGGVGDTERQPGRGVEARAAEVEARGVAATEAWMGRREAERERRTQRDKVQNVYRK